MIEHPKSWVYIPQNEGHLRISVTNGQIDNHTEIPLNLDSNIVYVDKNGPLEQTTILEGDTLTLIPTLLCNEHCVMCPQHKEETDIGRLSFTVAKHIEYSRIKQVYITGGEPYLASSLLCEIIDQIPDDIEISILTNGTLDLIASPFLLRNRLRFCIPLYASVNDIHDKIVGFDGFYKTLKNLFHLGNNDVTIELRNVITKQNYKNLPLFAHYIYNNIPFVANVALMGIELTEDAKRNSDSLWVEPSEYTPYLAEAVQCLDDCGISCDLFNMPLCCLPNELRSHYVASISPWKRRYLDKCKNCGARKSCGGMFFSSATAYTEAINSQ
jgi:Predicted Fe-S oxidoreductases